jgi:hypothetical protein
MIKKMFALASVTALTGLVAAVAASGCSSTTTETSNEAGPVVSNEAGDAKKPVPEAGEEPDADMTGGTCPTTDPIDATTAPWKAPTPPKVACTEKQIADLVAYVEANPKTDYAKLKATVTDTTCAKCLFVPDTTNWGPFVEKADGSFERNNFGGCVAAASGKESCGKAFSQFDDCLAVACQDCADDTATQKCNTAAAKGACKTAASSFATECGNADAVDTCDKLATKYTFEAASRALCTNALANDGG